MEFFNFLSWVIVISTTFKLFFMLIAILFDMKELLIRIAKSNEQVYMKPAYELSAIYLIWFYFIK